MEIRLPRLGEGADSGTVATIFVKEGDRITKDQPVLELESEKAVASIPSPVEGVVGNGPCEGRGRHQGRRIAADRE